MSDCHPLNTRPKAEPGAYQLCDSAGDVVYIGQSENLRDRIAAHAKGEVNPCIAKNAAGYRYWLGEPAATEKRLVTEFKATHGGRIPMCNSQDPSA